MTTKTVYGWLDGNNVMFMSSFSQPTPDQCPDWFQVDNVDVDRTHRIEWDGSEGRVVYDIEDYVAPLEISWLTSRPAK
jgi:hypothetical protein